MSYYDEAYALEQYELECLQQQAEQQALEHQEQEHFYFCAYVAENWLMGECNQEDADSSIYGTGDRHGGVLYWAQVVLDHTQLSEAVS